MNTSPHRAGACRLSSARVLRNHVEGGFSSARWLGLLVAICAVSGGLLSNGATLPSGFGETRVVSGLSNPTTMEFAPDGRLFVSQQAGALRVVKNGVLLATPFMTLDVENTGERGLLGIAFDPGFATNQYLYVYYTSKVPTLHNRVSRFTASGDTVLPGSEVVILDLNDLSAASNHNGGAIHFGVDGKLYIGVGENAQSSNSQTLNNLLGKLLRINSDGTIPTDNPFYNTAVGVNRAIWAMGLRNPFSFGVQPGTGRIFINDVGQNAWEEIDEAIAGANYGWPSCEANCNPSNPLFTDPIYRYPHATGTDGGYSVVGGVFYNPSVPNFPGTYTGHYFFADYVNSWLKVMDPANGFAVTTFATGLGLPVDLKLGPDGGLYYLSRGDAVYVIKYLGNPSPQITSQPVDRTVFLGTPASFVVAASGVAPLSYQWQRNGANIPGATSTTYSLTTTVLSDDGAAFLCLVSNPGGTTPSQTAVLRVATNAFPVGNITLPANGLLYAAGDVINYAATATDREDGSLPASGFSWTIVFHHDTHTHPFLGPINGVTSGSFAIPTLGETSANVWYRVHLTVNDSTGQIHTSFVDVVPKTSRVTLNTVPPGLEVTLDGQPLTTPTNFVGVVGMPRALGVVSPQSLGSSYNEFVSWSDSGSANHNVVTPAADAALTATFASTPLVTSTFSNPGFIAINDFTAAAPYPSTMRISGLASAVSKVTVTLHGLYHTFPADIDALLVSPSGQKLMLFSDAGSALDIANVSLTFDDAASAPVPDSGQIVSGFFSPSNYDPATDNFAAPAPAGPYITALSSLKGGNPNGVWSLYIQDDGASDVGSVSNGWSLTFSSANTAPTLGVISDLSIPANGSSGPLAFTIGDAETPAAALTLSGSSSNPTLIPAGAIVFGGSGSSRTVTLTPAANQSGSATITVTVSDGLVTATRTFVATVVAGNALPTISAIPNQVVPKNGASGPLPLTVGDTETPASSLVVAGNSSNQSLLPDSNIVLAGNGANRTVTVSPLPGQTGTAVVTVKVTDASGGTASTSFQVTVTGLTTFANAATIAIPGSGSATPYPSTIAVSGLPGNVTKVTVTLTGMGHTYPDDLDILLVSPTGQKVLLMSDAGASGDLANVSLTFDDAASGSLPDSTQIVSGPYKPTNFDSNTDLFAAPAPAAPYGVALSDFVGSNPNGTWSLFVLDDSASDQGSIAGGWSLSIDTAGGNVAPTISDVPNLSISQNTSTLPIGFTVGDAETAAGSLVVTASSSDQTLVPDANILLGGSASNRTITVTPVTNRSGSATLTITVSDGTTTSSDQFVLTVLSVNTPPTMTDVLDRAIVEDVATGAIVFTVGDIETPAGSLLVTASSSNAGLVPDANIVLAGGGAIRTATITPLANQFGSTTITLSVSDGALTSSDTFVLTVTPVNDAPTITPIGNITINEDAVSAPIVFAVADLETAADSLSLTATSSDLTLFPNGSLVLTGTGSNRAITVTPGANQFGTATVSVLVSDGALANTSAFTVTVTSVNDLPTVSAIGNQSVVKNGSSGPLSFTLGDVETPAGSLLVVGTSSVQALVPDANIVLGGSGANRTVVVTPAIGQTGAATITLKVTDTSGGTTQTSFQVNVSGTATFANTASINIPGVGSATPYPSSIAVSGLPGAVSKLTVTLTGLSHTFPDDMDILLVGPTGQKVLLISDVGGGPDVVNATLVFDEAAPASLGDVTQIVSGTFKPTNFDTTSDAFSAPAPAGPYGAALSDFVGSIPNGTWSLYVMDDAASDAGSIAGGWSLSIEVSGANTAPTISDVADLTINQSTATSAIAFTIGDAESAAGILTVTASSSNQTLVPNANIVLGGSGSNRTVTVTPVSTQSGSGTITLTVSDGLATVTDTFVLTVIPVNLPPTISDITDLAINEDSSAGPIPFVVGDVETPAANLTVSASSSNPTLVPKANIVLSGSDANRTISVSPAPNQFGTATLTVSVNDGTVTTSDTFVLTVKAVNDIPTISSSPNQTVLRNTSTSSLSFTVGDLETPAASLVVTGSSSNPTLVPNSNIVVGGTGSTRTLVITPASGQTGNAVITLVVTDADGGSSSTSFQLRVANVVTFSNPTSIVVPTVGAATPNPSTISVSGLSGTVVKLSVTLTGVSHTYPDDLDILLVGPSGQKVMLMSDTGGSQGLFSQDLTFDDTASVLLPDVTQIVTGTYKPTNNDTNTDGFSPPAPGGPYGSALSDFAGIDPNGTWSLYVVDDATSDQGSIAGGWSISLSAYPPQLPVTNSNTATISIPDVGTVSAYPSTITVSGVVGVVAKVTVSLNALTHTYPDDLDVLLVSPSGQKIILMSDAGASGDLFGANLLFDDAALDSLPDASQIVSGSYKPTNFDSLDTFPAPAPAGPYGSSLTEFVGGNPNGVWSLYIVDDSTGDVGSIAGGWTLTVASSLAVPPPGETGGVLSGVRNDLSFSSVQVSGSDSILLTLHGKPGDTFVIEASSDLSSWVEIGRGIFSEATAQFTDRPGAEATARFYRARTAP